MAGHGLALVPPEPHTVRYPSERRQPGRLSAVRPAHVPPGRRAPGVLCYPPSICVPGPAWPQHGGQARVNLSSSGPHRHMEPQTWTSRFTGATACQKSQTEGQTRPRKCVSTTTGRKWPPRGPAKGPGPCSGAPHASPPSPSLAPAPGNQSEGLRPAEGWLPT